MSAPTAAPSDTERRIRVWLLLWGGLLGLSVLKFGNPVVLDRQIPAPGSWSDAMSDPWPVRWAWWLLLPLVLPAIPWMIREGRTQFRHLNRWLWVPAVLWFGWQVLSMAQTVDRPLSALAITQFAGVLVAYGTGLTLITNRQRLSWAMAAVVAAFCLCLMRSVNQRLEFPQMRAALLEGERTDWTNFPPATVLDLERQQFIISTNGVRRANPLILVKLERERVYGTLVYPNALASVVLLLLPLSWTLVSDLTRSARPVTRWAALGLVSGLGVVALVWSGSKSGWLIALLLLGALGWRQPLPRRLRTGALALLAIAGILAFAIRFRGYFAAGATSVGARMDYWSAAWKTTLAEPILGTGPGTFQRPYARLKSPDSEMARLAHNDYLEQFSDSGIPGGVLYGIWVGGWMLLVGRRCWASNDPLVVSAFLGTAAWFAQGVSEFGLYVPALAWTAFTLAGATAGITALQTIPSAIPPRSGPHASATRKP
ncbi:MAG: O-antigen ligase family protein [Verrucomicrobiales bacterium]|nr:O-antigen ligase family protein [Verrucomicrobiales bacterium]